MERTATSARAARHWPLALLAAGATLLLAGCAQVGSPTLTFWDVMWSFVAFFFWFTFIWIFISLFGDIFRRDDLSGAAKAGWLLLLVVLPFLGSLIYIVMRPKVTAQDVQTMARMDASQKAVAGVTTADEIAKLQQLKDAGAITAEEFENLKRKTMAS